MTTDSGIWRRAGTKQAGFPFAGCSATLPVVEHTQHTKFYHLPTNAASDAELSGVRLSAQDKFGTNVED